MGISSTLFILILFLISFIVPILMCKIIVLVSRQDRPSMGGILIFIPLLLILPFIGVYWPIFLLLFSFWIIGIIDDIMKISSSGMMAIDKFAMQVLFAASFLGMAFLTFDLDRGELYLIFCILLIVGLSNGVNFSDGIDGLASISYMPPLLAIMAISSYLHHWEVFCFSISLMGSLLGFYLLNSKGYMIMGDSGSLPLGAILGGIAILLECEGILIFSSMIFLFEILSKILGSSMFGGDYITLHERLQSKGYSNSSIVKSFLFVSSLFTLVSLLLFLARVDK